MSANLEKGLYSVLSGNSPQTSAAGRIYPRLPQQATYPAVRYQRIDTNRTQAINANVGVTATVVQVDCMGESYSDGKTLADEVRTILHGYSGAWGSLTCHNCVLESETDLEYIDGDEVLHWVSQRYTIYTDMD